MNGRCRNSALSLHILLCSIIIRQSQSVAAAEEEASSSQFLTQNISTISKHPNSHLYTRARMFDVLAVKQTNLVFLEGGEQKTLPILQLATAKISFVSDRRHRVFPRLNSFIFYYNYCCCCCCCSK